MSVTCFDPGRFYRLKEIIAGASNGNSFVLPIGVTAWYQGIRAGRFPRGVMLAPNCRAWSGAELNQALEELRGSTSQIGRPRGRGRTRVRRQEAVA